MICFLQVPLLPYLAATVTTGVVCRLSKAPESGKVKVTWSFCCDCELHCLGKGTASGELMSDTRM